MKLITKAIHCMVKLYNVAHPLKIILNLVYLYEINVTKLLIFKVEIDYYTSSL